MESLLLDYINLRPVIENQHRSKKNEQRSFAWLYEFFHKWLPNSREFSLKGTGKYHLSDLRKDYDPEHASELEIALLVDIASKEQMLAALPGKDRANILTYCLSRASTAGVLVGAIWDYTVPKNSKEGLYKYGIDVYDLRVEECRLEDQISFYGYLLPTLKEGDALWNRVHRCARCNRLYIYNLERSKYCSRRCRDNAWKERRKNHA